VTRALIDPRSKRDDVALASRPVASLASIGTSLPERVQRQREFTGQMARLWRLSGMKLDRWRRIVAGSGVEKRHGVAAIEEIIRATTAERMQIYQRHAPSLAHAAATAALNGAHLSPRDVTDLIIVSCTGFVAPGIDVALMDALELPATVRRNTVGFMGCFGAITGLRAAIGAVTAAPPEEDATAIVVCVELCSLHLRDSIDDDNLVASAIFGDGAAAAVVRREWRAPARSAQTSSPIRSPSRPKVGNLAVGGSMLAPCGRADMTWRITDSGFAMTIDPSVPRSIEELVPRACDAAGIEARADMRWIVHPGGPRILDAVEDALALPAGALDPSRRVLRRCGNMSSGTVLFVLEEILREGGLRSDAALLAFGPGLTVEIMPVYGGDRNET
jgi:predicted naringenin-chalcone synthase